MARFHAPPGWPPPPDGWTPPEGWMPPKEWPKAPEGWQYWTTDDGEPVGSTLEQPAATLEQPPEPGARLSDVPVVEDAADHGDPHTTLETVPPALEDDATYRLREQSGGHSGFDLYGPYDGPAPPPTRQVYDLDAIRADSPAQSSAAAPASARARFGRRAWGVAAVVVVALAGVVAAITGALGGA